MRSRCGGSRRSSRASSASATATRSCRTHPAGCTRSRSSGLAGDVARTRRTLPVRPLKLRRMARFVFDFDEPSGGGRELLGGKGIGLAEMTQLGLPVPAGFTITTDACRDYMRAGDLPEGLEAEVDEHVARLEHRTGKRFGDDADPLLVSVRSGAAVSMPGMMDTILNLGLNDEAAAGLAARTGNPRFAYDSYRRLVQMFGEVVDGVDPHSFEQALSDLKQARGAQQDTDLAADDLRGLVETFGRIYHE